MLNFDHNYRSLPSKEVLEVMLPFLQKRFSRKEIAEFMNDALLSLYALIDADSEDHMVYASSISEAINHSIFSTYIDVTRKTGKNHFVTSSIDEAPSIMGLSRLQELGCVFEMASPNSQGVITKESIAETITPRTALVSLTMANGLTGVIHEIETIASLCKERGILLHIDASHAISTTPFSFKKGSVDFVTINAESLHAPTGALLFIKKEHALSPLIIGSHEQGGLRGGNFSYPSFFGLAKAAKITYEERESFSLQGAMLRDLLEEKLHFAKPIFSTSPRLPHITAIDFLDITSDTLLYFLQKKQLYAMQGGGQFQKISHILKASDYHCHSALSFTFSRDCSEEMVLLACQIIEECYYKLKTTTFA